jgi:hypothetical protein
LRVHGVVFNENASLRRELCLTIQAANFVTLHVACILDHDNVVSRCETWTFKDHCHDNLVSCSQFGQLKKIGDRLIGVRRKKKIDTRGERPSSMQNDSPRLQEIVCSITPKSCSFEPPSVDATMEIEIRGQSRCGDPLGGFGVMRRPCRQDHPGRARHRN